MEVTSLFDKNDMFNYANDNGILKYPNLSYTRNPRRVHLRRFAPPPPPDVLGYEAEYLTLTALEDNFMFIIFNDRQDITYQYSTDKQEWYDMLPSSYATEAESDEVPGVLNPSIAINAGESFYIKVKEPVDPTILQNAFNDDDFLGVGEIDTSTYCAVSGNVMSMLFGDDFVGKKDLTGYYCAFARMFAGNEYMCDARYLVLPATTLEIGCYIAMFGGCYLIVAAPELPAPTLTEACYLAMFDECTGLRYIKMMATDITANECLAAWIPTSIDSQGLLVHHIDLQIEQESSSPTLINPTVFGTDATDNTMYVPTYWRHFGTLPYENQHTEYFTITPIEGINQYIPVVNEEYGFMILNDRTEIQYEYSFDKVEWHQVHTLNPLSDVSENEMLANMVFLQNRQSIYLRANITPDMLPTTLYDDDEIMNCGIGSIYLSSTSGNHCFYIASGNVMSFVYGDNFADKTDLSEYPSVFVNLFYPSNMFVNNVGPASYDLNDDDNLYMNKLYDASNLILPATTLGPWSYVNMFKYCTSLIDAPKILPATQLETIDDYTQYDSMFCYCESLVCGPELNVDILPEYGYSYMFGDCTNICYIKMNTSDISADECLSGVLSSINYDGHVICNPIIADEIRNNYLRQRYYVNGVSNGGGGE